MGVYFKVNQNEVIISQIFGLQHLSFDRKIFITIFIIDVALALIKYTAQLSFFSKAKSAQLLLVGCDDYNREIFISLK